VRKVFAFVVGIIAQSKLEQVVKQQKQKLCSLLKKFLAKT
jgi:hypothetical protein